MTLNEGLLALILVTIIPLICAVVLLVACYKGRNLSGKMVIVYDKEGKSFLVYENGQEYQADSYWRLVQVIQRLHEPEDEIYWTKE